MQLTLLFLLCSYNENDIYHYNFNRIYLFVFYN